MNIQSTIGGFEPDYHRFEINRDEEGWTVVCRAADDARYLSPENVISTHTGLNWGEVQDVVLSTLVSYEPF